MICNVYFGLPGSGKTTHATKLAIDEQRKIEKGTSQYSHVMTNFKVNYPGIEIFDISYMKEHICPDSLIIIDEATLSGLDCRNYKSFDQAIQAFVMLVRHQNASLRWYSQGWSTLDLRIRQITDEVYYIHKGSIRRWITYINKIGYFIDIPEKSEEREDYQIKEGYYKQSRIPRMFSKRFRRKKYYKYFDSWDLLNLKDRKECPRDTWFNSNPSRPQAAR